MNKDSLVPQWKSKTLDHTSAVLPSGLVTLTTPCLSFPICKTGPVAQTSRVWREDSVQCHPVGASPRGLILAVVAFHLILCSDSHFSPKMI